MCFIASKNCYIAGVIQLGCCYIACHIHYIAFNIAAKLQVKTALAFCCKTASENCKSGENILFNIVYIMVLNTCYIACIYVI